MPAYARKEIVDESDVGVYHCIARCVRRAFLCGVDRYSGKNFDHRKVWVRERLEELAAIFAVDVLGFSIMSNHMHVLLRNRPDVAHDWSEEDIARRWWQLHPMRRNEDGTPAEPESCELAAIQADPERVAVLRRRLASLSWLMRSLCEPIARRANREDRCTGRFLNGSAYYLHLHGWSKLARRPTQAASQAFLDRIPHCLAVRHSAGSTFGVVSAAG